MKNRKHLAIYIFVSTVFLFTVEAKAVSFSGEKLFGGDTLISTVDGRSYDTPVFNAFEPFEDLTNTSNALVLNSFVPDVAGTILEVTLLSEAAGYADRNAFGVVGGDGNFVEILGGSNVPSDSNSLILTEQEDTIFALKSPQGVLGTDSEQNSDKATHVIGLEVTKAGTVFIANTTLSGGSLTFDLLAGDLLLFMEDLLVVGNINNVNPSDFDYNDMVVVVRQTEVPEPATLLLVSMGLFGLGALRKQHAI